MSYQPIIPSSPCNHSLNTVGAFGMSNLENGKDQKTFTEHPVWDCTPPDHGKFLNNSGRDIINGVIGNNTSLALENYLLDFNNSGESVNFISNREIEDDHEGDDTPFGDFYDAFDELSSDGEKQNSMFIIKTELQEIRSSYLKEIERRKQTEETLEKMQLHWCRIREQLANVSLYLPLDPTTTQYSLNLADEFRCQLDVTRFVCDLAKAEVKNLEMEMDSVIKAKNFEISRLSDRLRYYKIANQEMLKRNREVIGRRKKSQRLIWGSIAATITLSSVVLACTYLPVGDSSLMDLAQPQETQASLE